MDFCEKCGSILVPAEENGKRIIKCSKCNKKVTKARLSIKEEIKREKVGEGVSEKEVQTLATVPLEQPCEKCGNSRAFHWFEQTRASDEPETEFFRCTKCKHTWREYS